MRDPLRRLKALPWIPLLQNALLTVLLATVLDIVLLTLLGLLLTRLSALGRLLQGLLQAGVVGLLLQFAVAAGVGALAVVLMEWRFGQVRLEGGTLWALVGCLAFILWLKSLLPIPAFLVGISYVQFVGLMLGLFTQGRSHWRW